MIEWEHLALFCQSDPDFFARPDRIADAADRLETARRQPPPHWERTDKDLWVRLRPAYRPLKRTGWKIHVSVTPADADHACAIVWDYCVEHDLPFKFLRSRHAIRLLNGKYADRSASGKTITVYPADDEELAEALDTLGRLLKGITGPYVLSDLRIGEGPLSVRYGAFTRLTCVGPEGEPVPGRLDGDGRIVPDVREPRFVLPQDVETPEVLKPHLEARGNTGADFPFAVESVMHYSNAGGVYLATREGTGERVVLVEARPHAGLDRNGRDAVARLHVQRDIMRRLAGLPCVPRLLAHHVAWEHHFLVEEHVEGVSLFEEMVRRYPYAHNTYGPPEPEVRAYTEWAAEITARIGEALDLIHGRGVRYGDLHPGNVIVRPDGQVVLVDYEYARDLDDTTVLDGGAPGFHAPESLGGAAADRYQLECVRVWLHLPMNMRPEHTPAQVRRAIGTVTDLFPVDEGFAAQAAAGFGLTGDVRDVADRLLSGAEVSWPDVRDSLVAGIMESASFSREGALFPGGPQQFATGGFTLAYGSAGVLMALHRVGAEVPAAFADWTAAQALRSPDAKPGLYDGLHGVAHVLDLLGHTDVALTVLERARAAEDRVATAGLLSGAAGHALNLLHFARRTGDEEHLAAATAIGARLATLDGVREPAEGGLIRGMSGVALCFVRLFETTGEPVWLERARAALQQDLDRGEFLGGETFHLVDHGTRRRDVMYVEGGSAGLAIVAHEYLRHRPDAELSAAVTGVRRGCRAPFTRGPSLFRGRAGFIATLAHLGHPGDHDVLMGHVPRLALHAQPYRGHLAFPSTKLLRLSMDVATGSAGVLLALDSAYRGGGSFLPFLSAATPEGR
ncbi:class III lanthionine synthetase LanKC [Nonomuraea sp. NPDC050790]|uniref:class III lanthionine synthetase LanKC n=1 Tax=Nonomuraea sp. NPDC050790 TaxID=3364371 RepID=UPI0037BB7B47